MVHKLDLNFLKTIKGNRLNAARSLCLVDLTSLNDDDTEDKISSLCDMAQTPFGKTAAVCVYSNFVPLAKKKLDRSGISVATVVNFPKGTNDLDKTVNDIKLALEKGADEIDVVFPYQVWLDGNQNLAISFIELCKKACGNQPLKVILETGAFPSGDLIFQASTQIIKAGADFLKTSTGKIKIGATLEAASQMLYAIHLSSDSYNVGFKASGGIRNCEEASQYLALADTIMGKEWAQKETFRFGASSLLKDLLSYLDDGSIESEKIELSNNY